VGLEPESIVIATVDKREKLLWKMRWVVKGKQLMVQY
jgi:hypothetical protein